MKFVKTIIPEVIRIEPVVYGDSRGFFLETWREEIFQANGLGFSFVQDNHSRSQRSVLRGLHYQLSKPQGKLVRVARGEIFDVAVDMRVGSPTFGGWVGEFLSDENHHQLWIPPGFAHGFLVTSDVADVVYRCTEYYAPDDERVLFWNDTDVAVDWPLGTLREPSLSTRDAQGSRFGNAETYS